MNYTRVLHALSHPQSAVTPLDLAKCLTLSQRQPLYQLLSMSPPKPSQRLCADYPQQSSIPSSTSSSSLASSHLSSGLKSCLRRYSSSTNKKRVVFADTKGLALTAVRLFIPEPSSPASTLLLRASSDKPQPSLSNTTQRHRLRLGFPQPMADFDGFLARLREMHVQLESCSISEHSLSGKVCTSHVNTERAAYVRVTFDSWWSHHDIPCTFLQQQRCAGWDVDIFTFDISLPQNVDPKEQIEFCVSFRPGPGSVPHWDDNRGQNYRLYVGKDELNVNLGSGSRYYNMLTKNCPSLCPPNLSASLQNPRVLQYPQRTLSNRVKVDWKTLVTTN